MSWALLGDQPNGWPYDKGMPTMYARSTGTHIAEQAGVPGSETPVMAVWLHRTYHLMKIIGFSL